MFSFNLGSLFQQPLIVLNNSLIKNITIPLNKFTSWNGKVFRMLQYSQNLIKFK